jgi:hypothetical protein
MNPDLRALAKVLTSDWSGHVSPPLAVTVRPREGLWLIREAFTLVVGKMTPSDWAIVRTRIEFESSRLASHPELAPPLVSQRLLVSGEDHRHGRHPGFDPIAIGRAVWRRLIRESHEGASTIEQQIVRVITGRYERTLLRKVREIFLAILVTQSFSKEVLPAVYIAIGYYGWRMNGYLQACQRLGFSPHCLTLDEAASLIARLKYPQPRKAPTQRMLQIERRAKHLRALHQRHINDEPIGISMAQPFAVDPSLSSPFPSPEELRQALSGATRHSREIVARLWLTEGFPSAFRTCPSVYEDVRGWLSSRLQVHPKEITLIAVRESAIRWLLRPNSEGPSAISLTSI